VSSSPLYAPVKWTSPLRESRNRNLLSRSFNQRSYDAATVGRQRGTEWEAEREWMKNLLCCHKRDPFDGNERFDVTPEAVYAMPDNFMIGCPKKCKNKKKGVLSWRGALYGPVLYQLAGECPSLPILATSEEDDDEDEDEWDKLLFEALFQMENYCYENYSDKYVPIVRVVDDQFKEVNKKVADVLKRADKEKLKKFCKRYIIDRSVKDTTEEMWARTEVWLKECGLTDSRIGDTTLIKRPKIDAKRAEIEDLGSILISTLRSKLMK